MKKIICALLACALGASSVAALSGCGCSDSKKQEPGYTVAVTEPDLKNDEFGFYVINQNELMVTAYFGDGKDVVIPDTFEGKSVSIIGHSVFNRAGLTSVEIPDTVTEVQDYAFAFNSDLKSVKLSKNLKVMGTNVFFSCRALESIELPATLKKIGPYAFSASGIKSVEIPQSDTLTSLGQYVFYQCPNLTEVTLPATVTNIADDTFDDCPNPIKFKAPTGSYGLSYAKSHGFEVEEIAR